MGAHRAYASWMLISAASARWAVAPRSKVVQPHAIAAIAAVADAARPWRELPFDKRAAVLLKAADLLSGPWRQQINAAIMLGQSKTAFQA
jgi:acyl-CoA reductase-like NAD-dependent aldehyde dehydrogenase